MTRLTPVSPESATGKTKELYAVIKSKLGVIPNMMQTMGNSSAFLQGYLSFNEALASGKLGARIGELIALTVAEANACNYCLSAHTYLSTNLVKIDDDAIESARFAKSTDPKTEAILNFARSLVAKRGQVNDSEIQYLKLLNVTEGEIGEIIGHVALNILTNYFNLVADTDIDFPVVRAGYAKAA